MQNVRLEREYPHAPASILQLVRGEKASEVGIGCSAARVFRIEMESGKRRYLKVQTVVGPETLAHEAAILEWLQGRLPAPEVLAFADSGEQEYLVISEVAGQDCVAAMATEDHKTITQLLAEGLRQVHTVGIMDCPFDERIDAKLAQARLNVNLGLVDEDDFDEERRGQMTAGEILTALQRIRPAESDLVFTHGDYCLPNIILLNSRVNGFIDLGRAGIADRYNDLAIASRSIRYNLGPDMETLFFESYGLGRVDREKIAYYRLMDELF